MRKLFLGLLIGCCLFNAPGWSKTPVDFKLGTLDPSLSDSGCSFSARNTDWSDPLFATTTEGNWIHINGEQIKLIRVEKPSPNDSIWEFTAENLRVLIKTGRQTGEIGAIFKRATLQITYQGQTLVIPVTGACAC
jgi:hypothetical protein